MIFLLVYLLIGCAFAVWLPIKQAQSRAKLAALSDAYIASLCEHKQDQLAFARSVIEVRYKTWQLVLAGLVWPVQILSWIALAIVVEIRSRR